MVARVIIIGIIIVAGVIAGISAALVISAGPVEIFEENPDESLTSEEINILE